MISLSTNRHATWAEVPSLFRLKDGRLKAGRLDIAGLMGSLLFRLTAQEPLTFMVVAVRVVVRRSPRVMCCPASDACGTLPSATASTKVSCSSLEVMRVFPFVSCVWLVHS